MKIWNYFRVVDNENKDNNLQNVAKAVFRRGWGGRYRERDKEKEHKSSNYNIAN